MAVTRNTYTGNGSTVLYSFTFPYLEATDIKVSVNGTTTTAYTLANATTIQFNTAPANGASIAIYRQTDDTALSAAFYPGSAIRSADLNDNFTQNLYVTQESNRDATDAIGYGQQAISTANGAVSTANAATATANTASSNASAAVATANTASSNASAAVSTANTASSNATTAVNTANAATATANSAAADAATAISTANSAVSTANSAVSTANSAVTTAGNAVTTANSAVSTATTASTNASNAVTTANAANSTAANALTTAGNAVTTANSAVSTANAADTKADQAINAVANALLFDIVANVAAIPASPSNNDAVEITNSTGIESFTPLSGLPAGFVGDAGLSVRLLYQSAGSTWTWLQYFPNDPDNRYAGPNTDAGTAAAPSIAFGPTDPNTGIFSPGADEFGIATGGVGRFFIDAAGNVVVATALSVNGEDVVVDNDTRLGPDFGAQNVTTTGTITGASLNPTSSTVPTNGVYLPAANSVAISTNGTQRVTVSSSGDVYFSGSSADPFARSDARQFAVNGVSASDSAAINVNAGPSSGRGGQLNLGQGGTRHLGLIGNTNESTIGTLSNTPLRFETNSTERLRITPAGLVGIGTSTVNFGAIDHGVHIYGSGAQEGIRLETTNGSAGILEIYAESGGNTLDTRGSGYIRFNSAATEWGRWDSSGRLLVGTSSSSNVNIATFQGNSSLSTGTGIVNIALGNTSPAASDELGRLQFTDSGHNSAAQIVGQRDGGTWNTSTSRPTRLVFSTTSDNASSPSERLRIASTGAFGLSGANYGSAGQVLTSQGSGAAPQWATAGGAWQFISSVTASSSATVDITSGINSTYDVYMLTITNVTFAVTGYELLMRTSSNGGSSYDSAANEYGWTHNPFVVSDSSTSSGNGSNGSHIRISRGNVSVSDGGKGLNSVIYIYKPSRSDNCLFSFSTTQHVTPISATPAIATFNGLGVRRGSSAVNALRFIMADASNINSGVFRLYGLKNS